jgi:hypothetical protein
MTMTRASLPLNRFGDRRGMNPGSSKGRFKPGGGGNPRNDRGGSPLSMVSLLKEELLRVPSKTQDGGDNKEKLTRARMLAQVIVDEALDGNVSLAREILERIDGKVTVAISGPGGGPLEVQQSVRIISQSEIRPALEALVSCGVVTISTN